MQKKLIPKMTTFGKWSVIILLAFILIWPLTVGIYWGLYKGYTTIDATRFPWFSSNMHAILDQTKPNSAEAKKGIALSAAISNRLEEEMGCYICNPNADQLFFHQSGQVWNGR
jgi:hypothetical protein